MITGKKIIITGIAGRVGSIIAEHFLKNKNEVWGYDLFHSPGSKELWDSKGVHTVKGDFAKGNFDGLPTDADYCLNLAANTMPGNFSEGAIDNAIGPTLLMKHCKDVKAFMHFSSSSIYTPTGDNMTIYNEEDAVGSDAEGYYSGTKILGEGAVMAMAKAYNIPTIQLRLSVYYGKGGDGGLLSIVYLNNLINNEPIEIIKKKPSYFSAIYDADIVNFMEPLLNAATTDAPIVNFISDDYLSVDEMVKYMSELTNIKPKYKKVKELTWPAMIINPEKRKSITGPSSYTWKEGIKEFVDYWYPILREEQNESNNSTSDSKYTMSTKLKEIRDLPGIIEFLSEKSGMNVPPYALVVGGGMTIKKAGAYLKWNDEQIKVVVQELNSKYKK